MSLKIDKKEVLRYLGGNDKSNDKITDRLIDEGIEEIKKISVPKSQFRIFDIRQSVDGIQILNSILNLKGKDIIKHLIHSKKVAIIRNFRHGAWQ